MIRKQLYLILSLTILSFSSCLDNDEIGKVEKVDLINFEFPQGDNPWDKEIEQIAKDWGMYIIYKDVTREHLNRRWTLPVYSDPIYMGTTPSNEDVQVYLALIKEWLLGSLDINKEDDRRQLPYYLYLINDLDDDNPSSSSYQRNHIQLKKDGLDYWSLSFTTEELEEGLTPKIIHEVACSFSYPGLKVRFINKEYKVAPDFGLLSDYETKIGVRYYSFEEFQKDNPWATEYDYPYMVRAHERDPYNSYQRRGFIPQVGEDFQPVTSIGWVRTYGAPTWMPWIPSFVSGDYEVSDNPGPVPETIEERILQDFLSTIRYAMTYPEKMVRSTFPLDTEDPLDGNGNEIIINKYEIVVEYMLSTYGIDLPKYADILQEEI